MRLPRREARMLTGAAFWGIHSANKAATAAAQPSSASREGGQTLHLCSDSAATTALWECCFALILIGTWGVHAAAAAGLGPEPLPSVPAWGAEICSPAAAAAQGVCAATTAGLWLLWLRRGCGTPSDIQPTTTGAGTAGSMAHSRLLHAPPMPMPKCQAAWASPARARVPPMKTPKYAHTASQ